MQGATRGVRERVVTGPLEVWERTHWTRGGTDSQVLCRLVVRWVGQGGKVSLTNTPDADILDYILVKLVTRIEAKSRNFLVKVKSHRGEPLNEGADDLTETGCAMEKEGDNYRWKERTTRVVYPYCDRNLGQWKKKWCKGLFE